MKKYIADILVLIRIILATALIVMAFAGGEAGTGFLLFVFGELADAFDGTCATKWPFPKNKAPKYRRYASKYDIYADMLLGIGMALFFIFQVNFVAGWIICGSFAALAIIIDSIVYGKIIGHPDDYKSWSLMAHNFKLAKYLVLARRRLYVTLIGLIAIWTLYASNWDITIKITLTVISAVIATWLWFFLAQRRNNISRDAVDIENKLGKKSK